jgi:hypothetical protein
VLDAAAAKKPESWGAAAWKLERFDRQQYGRRDHVDVSGTLTLVQLRALLVGIVKLVERYVPEHRRHADLPTSRPSSTTSGKELPVERSSGFRSHRHGRAAGW